MTHTNSLSLSLSLFLPFKRSTPRIGTELHAQPVLLEDFFHAQKKNTVGGHKGDDEDAPLILRVVRCFSFTENLRTLTNMDQRFPQTACLEGLRVLSMQWVILGHTLLVLVSGNLDNTIYLFSSVAPRFTYQPVINATVSVDSFFTISGFLLAYVSLRKLRKIGKRGKSTIATYAGVVFTFFG